MAIRFLHRIDFNRRQAKANRDGGSNYVGGTSLTLTAIRT